MGDKTDSGSEQQDTQSEGAGKNDTEQDDKNNYRPVQVSAVDSVEPPG
jgi:hypothetical protein